MGANELTAELWRQRQLLETLLFKFETERLMITSGLTRWIPMANSEVDAVVAKLKTASLSLALTMVDVAQEYGLREDAPLIDVVNAAPEGPWKDIFTAHRNALAELTAEIRAVRDDNTRLLRQGLRSAQETLNLMAESSSTYTADGSVEATIPTARLIDATL